jgi:hypothetical protein
MYHPPRQSGAEPSSAKTPGTRSQATKVTEKTKEQLLAISKVESDIFEASQARNFLEKHSYVASEDELTWAKLVTIVLQISQNSGKIHKHASEGMRAVALMMDHMQAAEVAERVTGKVADKLQPMIETLTNLTEAAGKAVEDLRAAAESSTRTMDVFREEAQTIKEAISGAAEELGEVNRNRREDTDQNDTGRTQNQPAMTYATVTKVQVTPQHEEVIARTHSREKQVLIEDMGEGGATGDMTERELVAKANMTVELLGVQAADRPAGENLFVGAKKLMRGGILYLMVSVEAAKWMRREDVKKAFEEKYGGQIQIKDRGHNIILEYVPVSFQPMSTTAQRTVERENGIEGGEIMSARYLKEEWRRAPGQRTAFVSMTIRSAQVANKILREGIIVEGRQVRGRKNIQEARRCMKCQGYQRGHIAARCTQDHDTCANCGQNHRTKDCDAPQDTIHCINCGTSDHKASDRNCPTFQRECTKIANKFPENKYQYFPIMDDPKTWGQNPQETDSEQPASKEGSGQREEDAESIRKRIEERVERESARILEEQGGAFNWDDEVRRERREDEERDNTSAGWRGGMRGGMRGIGRGGGRGRGSGSGNANGEGNDGTTPQSGSSTQRQSTLNSYVTQGNSSGNDGQ